MKHFSLLIIITFIMLGINCYAMSSDTLSIAFLVHSDNDKTLVIKHKNMTSINSQEQFYPSQYINQFDLKIIKAFAHDNNYQITVSKLNNKKGNYSFPSNIDMVANLIVINPSKNINEALNSLPITKITPAAVIRCQDINSYATYSQIKYSRANIAIDNDLLIKPPHLIFKHAKIAKWCSLDYGIRQLLNHKQSIIITNSINANFEHLQNPKLCSIKLKTNDLINGYSIFLFHNTSSGKQLHSDFNNWWLLNKGKYLED